jgi:hypothetical protein
MMYRTFRYTDCDEDYGAQGLEPMWIPGFNAIQRIAHDFFEHSPPGSVRQGAMHEETVALGRLLALRIDSGALMCRKSYEYELGMTLAGPLDDFANSDRYEILPMIETRPLSCSVMESVIQRSIPIAFEHCDFERDDFPAHWPLALASLLRIGYRDALKRYSKGCIFNIGADLFEKLDKVSEKISNLEILPEGAEVVIGADIHTNRVSASVKGWPRYMNEELGYELGL